MIFFTVVALSMCIYNKSVGTGGYLTDYFYLQIYTVLEYYCVAPGVLCYFVNLIFFNNNFQFFF